MPSGLKRFLIASILLILSVSIGILGYMLIEGYVFLDALYMTMLIISTVGFKEVEPLSSQGRLFTSVYLVINIGILAYIVSQITSYIFEGQFREAYKMYKVRQLVKKMDNHVIVCGYGRNGSKACEELIKTNQDFVLVEQNNGIVERLPNKKKFVVVSGDALDDDTLLMAGIKTAKAVITTLARDADNVMLTLSAKELNPKVFVVARASDDKAEKKLKRAGADKIVKPYSLAGIHLANVITRPYTIDFLDLITGVGGELKLAEFTFTQLKPEYKNKTIRELNIRAKTGGTIIGLKDPVKGFLFNPSPDTKIDEGDVMIVFGSKESIEEFQLYCT